MAKASNAEAQRREWKAGAHEPGEVREQRRLEGCETRLLTLVGPGGERHDLNVLKDSHCCRKQIPRF